MLIESTLGNYDYNITPMAVLAEWADLLKMLTHCQLYQLTTSLLVFLQICQHCCKPNDIYYNLYMILVSSEMLIQKGNFFLDYPYKLRSFFQTMLKNIQSSQKSSINLSCVSTPSQSPISRESDGAAQGLRRSSRLFGSASSSRVC